MKKLCKFCKSDLGKPFLDLKNQPLCNNFVNIENSQLKDELYPLEVFFCSNCKLVQLAHEINPEKIFNNYSYLSSYSQTWIEHAKKFSQKVIEKFNLNNNSFVVEIASNDGYLLTNFVQKNIPCIGIEPAKNIAEISESKGIKTIDDFFTLFLSQEIVRNFGKADLIISNNVYAHAPNIKDFTYGVKNLLKENGIWTIEVPYLKSLIENNQFDTIYHEHYFYFSVISLNSIMNSNELKIYDIEKLESHGGSLRLYITHKNNNSIAENHIVFKFIQDEKNEGFERINTYTDFNYKVNFVRTKLTDLLHSLKKDGKTISGYGAPGKGNTLLNFCNIDSTLINFTVDKNPLKQNTLLPGSRIPVYPLEKLKEKKPDYVIILPWNLKREIMEEISFIKSWGGKFIIPIPNPQII
ncbi:MAG: class I SAM-dependent methyltransferase [Melioribacteraceae bacterium]